jgi:hypothetical protein
MGSAPSRVRGPIVAILNEFYKKGCQEKSFASTGGRDVFLEIQPTLVSLLWSSLLCGPFPWVSLLILAMPSSLRDSKPAGASEATMVLSEARGLSLFLVIRGGIACNG